MMWDLFKPVSRIVHRHDYEMVFDDDDPSDPFKYKLVCKCGDVAPNMHIAIRRMQPWYVPKGW